MKRPLFIAAAVLVFGVYLVSLREGSFLYQRMFSPPSFRVLLDESGSLDTELSGRVLFSETSEEGCRFYLRTEEQGVVLCSLPEGEACPLPGAKVLVQGQAALFQTAVNPGMFDTRHYYDCLGIWFRVRAGSCVTQKESRDFLSIFVHRFRERAREVIRNGAEEEDIPVFLAIFCRDSSLLTDGERNAAMVGFSFLISFSGLHIVMISGAVGRFFRRRYGKIPALTASSLVSVLLFLLTGMTAAVFRGLIVSLMRAAAPLTKRRFDSLSAGALSLILLILYHPAFIFVSSFSYMLSTLLCTALFYPALSSVLRVRNRTVLSAFFILSLQCFLLPVRLCTSYAFDFLSVPLSALGMMIFPLLLGAVWFGTLMSLFSGTQLSLFFLPASVILRGFRRMQELAEDAGLTVITGRPSRGRLLLYYLLLLLVYLFLRGVFLRNRELPEEKEWVPGAVGRGLLYAVLAAVFAAGILFLRRTDPPGGGSTLIALSVGQGDANLLLTGNGEAYVIDCGSSGITDLYDERVRPTLRYYGIRHICAVFVTHSDTDHVSGLPELLRDVRVSRLICPDYPDAEEDFAELMNEARAAGAEVSLFSRGDTLNAGDGKSFSCLWPAADQSGLSGNELSLVLAYRDRDYLALYTGDISSETEAELDLTEVRNCDYLKVAHHGSRYSTSASFLAEVRPLTASVSCSRTNSYGHPSPEVLERLRESGTEVHLLYLEGAMVLNTAPASLVCPEE